MGCQIGLIFFAIFRINCLSGWQDYLGFATVTLLAGETNRTPLASPDVEAGFLFHARTSSSKAWRFAKQKKPLCFRKEAFVCRGGRIRTYDLHIPNVARYRATLHPDRYLFALSCKGIANIRKRHHK